MKITKKDIGKIVITNAGEEYIIALTQEDEVDGDVFFLMPTTIPPPDVISPNYWVNAEGMAYESCWEETVKEFK